MPAPLDRAGPRSPALPSPPFRRSHEWCRPILGALGQGLAAGETTTDAGVTALAVAARPEAARRQLRAPRAPFA